MGRRGSLDSDDEGEAVRGESPGPHLMLKMIERSAELMTGVMGFSTLFEGVASFTHSAWRGRGIWGRRGGGN